ncbi:MAG: hypothetical protein JWS10_1010 [Cypionkella sp.]|uniref:glycosyltransferase family 2 protein n=1 Tax=Cypionkella sp. TaxID=2811411 RepID=UPI00262B29D0|nr:glycosyltransferase family 2 protein [Cypionkella sp.]MDB5658395.1 hypothetical protein [Cypionkella sp.]
MRDQPVQDQPVPHQAEQSKKVACITTVRNDRIFLRKWIEYYGGNFGRQSLFVIIDGLDEAIPQGFDGVNFLHLRHRDWAAEISNTPMRRVVMEHNRSRAISDLARTLWRYDCDAVIATDVDEFLVADPAKHSSLNAFIQGHKARTATLSGLGLDVVQDLKSEPAIDPSQPFLPQRRLAVVSNAYTKPVLAFKPVTWGAGLHRVKRRNFHISPDLFMFHFGMIDYETAMGRANDPNLIAAGWGPHMQRREVLFRMVEAATPVEGEPMFDAARRRMTWKRRLLAWNKPAPLPGPPVVIIPDRLRAVL